MSHHDVIVLGLGGMGSAAAANLAGRGLRVLGLERHTPAHALGASHGGSRVTRQSYFEDPAYVPLLLRAYDLWEALERETGADLLHLTGGLFFGDPSSTVVRGSLRSAREWDLPHDELDAAEIARRFPTMEPEADAVGLYEERAGFVRPEATVRAHLGLAARRGADLRFEDPATAWEAHDDGTVTVRTAGETHRADHLLVCPGAWAPDLLPDLALPLRVTRQVMWWFAPTVGAAAFDEAHHPVYVHEDAAGLQVYGFPAHDDPADGVKVAYFRSGLPTAVAELDRTLLPGEEEAFRRDVAAVVPGLPGALLQAKVCMYTNTPDEHFVIARGGGEQAFAEQVTVACGFSGHGFKFVPVIGEILGDLVAEGATAHPIGLFDPRRPALVGSAPAPQAAIPGGVPG